MIENNKGGKMGSYFIITGASSGLGKELKNAIEKNFYDVVDWSKEKGVDITKPESISKAVKRLDASEKLLGLINCAGVNYINWFEKIPLEEWDRVMNTNARGMFLVTQALAKRLKNGVVCNVISNASHMPMTHSAAYNASKGAAHILSLQMGRELKKTHNITVFGVSPNKLKGTGMSKEIETRVLKLRGWTKEEAAKYQLAALPAGEETDPKACAKFITMLVTDPSLYRYMNCTVLPFGG